jgi:hypothetical protein
MKNCLICQTGQDQVSLSRISIKLEGAPWGDMLVCKNCMEMLGVDEVKSLIGIAVKEKSFEASNIILVNESVANASSASQEEDAAPGMLEMPVSAALLRDSAAFSRKVGEKIGGQLWNMHCSGPSDAVWTTSLTPDGEGGYILAAVFAKAPAQTT